MPKVSKDGFGALLELRKLSAGLKPEIFCVVAVAAEHGIAAQYQHVLNLPDRNARAVCRGYNCDSARRESAGSKPIAVYFVRQLNREKRSNTPL